MKTHNDIYEKPRLFMLIVRKLICDRVTDSQGR